MSKHQKHSNINRKNPVLEIGLLGTNCNRISQWVEGFSKNSSLKVAYLDGSHDEEESVPNSDSFTFNDKGFYTISSVGGNDRYQRALILGDYDIVFVNSNHFEASKQIVFLDPKKKASVGRRKHQLTNVLACVSIEEEWVLYEDLNGPILTSQNDFFSFIESQVKPAEINGLLVLGGKSSRMGQDKGELVYRNKPQRFAVQEMLTEVCSNTTYVSVAKEQYLDMDNRIEDSFMGLGPMGGILSAFKQLPDAAFLVLPNDLPNMTASKLSELIAQRDPSKYATAFIGETKDFPEPLVCIYEPRAYRRLLEFMALGYACPRKMLINSDVKVIRIEEEFIENANSPEDYKRLKHGLQQTD